MKTKTFRIMTFLSVLFMLISTTTQVWAAEPRATNYIMSNSCGLTRASNENLDIYYSVTAGQIVDQLGVYYIQIQKSSDQQTWSTETVLYYFNYPELVRNNTCSHVGVFTYTGTRGYYYRANIHFYAKNDGNSERTSMYTQTVYIPPAGNGGRVAE